MTVIAGNWKMHMSPDEGRAFVQALDLGGVPEERELILFPPAVSLDAVCRAVAAVPRVGVGVQNVYWEQKGAFTGETSAWLAAATGATHCLVGHSERRHVFGETDADTARKIAAARMQSLTPVLCVGETLEERRAGRVDEVIVRQLDAALPALGDGTSRCLVAYEPVWAIGTGETATPDDASASHATLRARLAEVWDAGRADAVPLLYGGSVKPENAEELLASPDVDGVLVGGASLDPASFRRIALAGS